MNKLIVKSVLIQAIQFIKTVLIQTTQSSKSIVFVYLQLNVETVQIKKNQFSQQKQFFFKQFSSAQVSILNIKTDLF